MPETEQQRRTRVLREPARQAATELMTNVKLWIANPQRDVEKQLKTAQKKIGRLRQELAGFDKQWMDQAIETMDEIEYAAEYKAMQQHRDNLDFTETLIEDYFEVMQTDDDADSIRQLSFQVADLQAKLTKAEPASDGGSTNSLAGLLERLVIVQEQQNQPLPEIRLPRFNGDATKFSAFWHSFKMHVHDRQHLSDEQRFKYLVDHLSGEPAKLFEGILPTGENYQKAIRYIIKRYGNMESAAVDVFIKLMSLPKIQKVSDTEQLKELMNKVNNCVVALDTMKFNNIHYAPMMYPILLRALPDPLVKSFLMTFENDCDLDSVDPKAPLPTLEGSEDLPKQLCSRFSDLRKFIANDVATRCTTARLSTSNDHNGQRNERKPDKYSSKFPKRDHSSSFVQINGRANADKTGKVKTNKNKSCLFCAGRHYHAACRSDMSVDQKLAKLNTAGYCQKCLKPGHTTTACQSNVWCHKCKTDQHMTVLCAPSTSQAFVGAGEALLPTGHVQLCSDSAKTVVRFMLDSGSQRTYITSRAAKQLNLKPEGHEWLYVHVFGGGQGKLEKFPVVSFKALTLSGKWLNFSALVTPKISNRDLPLLPNHVRNLIKDEVAEQRDGPVELDFLLNASDMLRVVESGAISQVSEGFSVLATKFGYVPVGTLMPSANPVNMIVTPISLEDFWKLEHIGIKNEELVEQKPNFEDLTVDFKKSIVFDAQNNRYVCRMNVDNQKVNQLGDNMKVARQQLQSLFKKLKGDPKLREAYQSEMKLFIDKGFAERIPVGEIPIYVLPHFPVVNPTKESYKVRPVFNASSHAKGQISLNDCIRDVPNLLPTSVETLLKFRTHKVGLAGDITKAYLTVGVHPEFRNAMCFLWAQDANLEKVELFRMTCNTFGIKDAQFNVICVIREHAAQYEQIYPNASKVLQEDLYMDDLLTGASTKEETEILRDQVKEVLIKAGMEIKKLRMTGTNHEVGEQPLAVPKGATKVLGVGWKEESDTLSFNGNDLAEFARSAPSTKRTIMGAVARLHDPVGLVSPFIMKLKLVLQEAHIKGLGLDKALPPELDKEWGKWCNQLKSLEKFKVERCYTSGLDQIVQQELHGFADASGKAYGGVVYLKSTDVNGKRKIALVASKARLTPLKSIEQLTIPRKELVAALCTARLTNFVAESLNLQNAQKFLWSDSTNVLHWIHGATPDKHGVFIRNRLTEILQISSPADWAHVEGVNNPADLPSRGCDMETLASSTLWLKGPKFLDGTADSYPRFRADPEAAITLHLQVELPLFDVTRFSSLVKAVRAYATFLRAARIFSNTQHRSGMVTNPGPDESLAVLSITSAEIQRAKLELIKHAQRRCFGEAVHQLEQGASCDDPRIKIFQPLLSPDGLLRVGGRLENIDEPLDVKHPIILAEDYLTRLIIEDLHVKGVRHLRTNVVLANLRQQFWVVRARQLVKKAIHTCGTCIRERAVPGAAMEATLPPSRVDGFTTPFKHVGVDYLGPFTVQNSKTQEKVWVALFTCNVVRAVHLEVVENLTGSACVDAIKRFVSCRGTPKTITSDNGLNFVRTERALRALWEALRAKETQTYLGCEGIEWHFNVPKAAWQGGLFERLVRVVKDCLRRSIKSYVLPLFQFMTLIKEIESIINSRPLTTIPDSARDDVPLTPAHFVASRVPIALPHGSISAQRERGDNLVQMWRAREQVLNKFWRRWRNEYILYLRSCHTRKGAHEKCLKVDDIVIIHQDNLPRNQWRLGRVVKVITGRDGVERSCEVQTSKGVIRRAVQHLCKIC